MPVTSFQKKIALLLAKNRSEDSYLAGGAALHFTPNSKRYSNDLDFFNDSESRVQSAFDADRNLLLNEGYSVTITLQLPSFIRAEISKGGESSKVEWAYDTAWRFMPTIKNQETGYQLHPVDLAINKLLALVGRNEPRDFIDILYIHEKILPLGALVWAAPGKDPGFTPFSLLELIKRRGAYREEDFLRLQLVEKPNLIEMKTVWLNAKEQAEKFIRTRPPSEVGALYYSTEKKTFIQPEQEQIERKIVVPHYGVKGGVFPMVG